jgi:hypothetical protein
MTAEDEITQAERRRVMRDTLHGRAIAEQGTIGGRYGAESKTRVIGSGVEYPRLPESSPWHSDPLPPPEPLGFPIDEMAPVGEPHEVAESLAREGINIVSPPNDPLCGDAEAPLGDSAPTYALRPASPPSTKQRIKRRP